MLGLHGEIRIRDKPGEGCIYQMRMHDIDLKLFKEPSKFPDRCRQAASAAKRDQVNNKTFFAQFPVKIDLFMIEKYQDNLIFFSIHSRSQNLDDLAAKYIRKNMGKSYFLH